MMPSALMKPIAPSVMTEAMNVQRIMPIVRKGRNSCIGVWKIWPNTMPMVPIMTPMLSVIQNGPSAERR